MQIFEYPYVIITVFVLCFIILGAAGVHFALLAVKAAKGTGQIEFLNVSRLENMFEKLGKNRGERSMIYIGVSLDNARNLYPDYKVQHIFSQIKPVLLKAFSEDGGIAFYDKNSFIALNRWYSDDVKANIGHCITEVNRILLKNKAINTVEIRFGAYSSIATDVTFDEAINRAKQALSVAEDEKVLYVQWDNLKGRQLQKKIKIENNIESEIDNNRFFLEYQPVIDAKTKKILGAEVLSRLNSESEGVLTPGSFLSAVDSVGLNHKFDYYIFEKNCKWISNCKSQREKYFYTTNFSRTTLCDPLFSKKISEIIEKYNLSYSSVAIEILEDENVTGEAKSQMEINLATLQGKGVLILLDDFGSGYTTFGDLQNLSIDIVKIDKSITQRATGETGFVILKNVIRTAKDLGFKTLCEGIETPEHEAAVISAGCDMLQGYYYYRPMPVAKLEAALWTNEEN